MKPGSQLSSTEDAIAGWLTAQRWLPVPLLSLPLAALRFLFGNGIQWSAALAYYTLIGLVPLLGVLFAIMKSFGVHYGLTPYIVSTVGAGSTEVADQIIDFIDATNVRAVGVLSAVAAALAVLGIMGNAEYCFNTIWGGVPGRPWHRKLASYGKVAISAPLLLIGAQTLRAIFSPGTRWYAFFDAWALGGAVLLGLQLIPYALLFMSFTILYTRLPNTDVPVRSAVAGAVVAGLLWQAAQWAYVSFVIGLVRYSAVYGALWQLPILLAWIYVAWCVILYGAQFCRTHQELGIARALERVR